MTTQIKITPLHQNHKDLDAKLVEFANYQLPIWFHSIKSEHLAVRSDVGLFDISHMGLFRISGENAFNQIQHLTCNDLAKTLNQTMVYSMFLNEEGTILDDVMHGFYQDQFYLITNGSNQEKIFSWMKQKCTKDLDIEHLNHYYAFLALQGPKSEEMIHSIFGVSLKNLKRFGLMRISLAGIPIMVFRTGYTGEDGFELMIPEPHASNIWEAFINAGVTPCGLGARDTLRIEHGYPLYGHELSESINPLMTRYAWVVDQRNDFIGKDALSTQKNNLKSVGLELEGRFIARENYLISEGGYITSGTLSPSLNKSIALGFVPVDLSSAGSIVTVKIRNHLVKATVVDIPFK